MQHSFLELHIAIAAYTQKCLGAIYSATFILELNQKNHNVKTHQYLKGGTICIFFHDFLHLLAQE